MLWTALIVILVMGFSIQVGWVIIYLLLACLFGRTGHQPTEQMPSADLNEIARVPSWRLSHPPLQDLHPHFLSGFNNKV